MQKPKDSTTPTESPYWCFISYRHADDSVQDRDWASWLHQEIERYDVPAELVGTRNKRGDIIPERIYPVFRDEVSLPADADLASSIIQALERSRFLVVLCSPRAVVSQYVAEEVLHFKQVGKEDRIVAAILDGEPGHRQLECFPAPLKHPISENGELDTTRKAEPIAADFRLPNGEQGFTSTEAYRLELEKNEVLSKQQIKSQADAYGLQLQLMKLKIIAGVLGVPLEQLRNRDKAYQLELAKRRARVLRRWLAAVGVLTLLVIGAGLMANNERIRAEIQEFRAINRTLETSLELVARFWNDGDVPQAVAGLSRAADLARMISDHPRAAKKEHRRSESLRRKLDLMRHGWRVLSEPEGVRDFAWSRDGRRVATLSEQGRLRLWDVSTGRPLAQSSTRLGDAKRIRLTNTGTLAFAAGDRAVQEAFPLYIWKWDPKINTIEEVFSEGNTDEGQDAEIRHFEMNPGENLFVLDFLGLIYLKQDASGQLIELPARGESVDEIFFNHAANLWLARIENSFVSIDPHNGRVTEMFTVSQRNADSKQSRLFSASGKHYAYVFQTRGERKVKWRELFSGGDTGEFFFKSPATIYDASKLPKDFRLARLSADRETLAIPVLKEKNQRVDLYDARNGAFVGVFRLPPGRVYTRIRFSPTYHAMAVPAAYGVEIWNPFFYESPADSEEKVASVTVEYTASGDVISLVDAEKVRTLELPTLRGADIMQHDLSISSVLRWPDQNHLLVGFSDFKIGYYQIEPHMKLEPLRTHHYDRESLSEVQRYLQRTEGLFINLASSPDRRHFISWSVYGGAKIWDVQNTESPGITLGSLNDIDQVLYSHDNDAIWALHGREADELSVFRTTGSHSLLRTIPLDFAPRIKNTLPNVGIAVIGDTWPNLIIDSNTGISLASYFHDAQGMKTPGAFVFRVVDDTVMLAADRTGTDARDYAIDERRTGYRWRADMAAPMRLSWDGLLEIWKDESK